MNDLIERHLDGETWRGVQVAGYRWKIPVGLGDAGWNYAFASHWSTSGHDNAERLFTQADVDALLTEAASALQGKDEEIARLEGELRSRDLSPATEEGGR